MKAKRDEGICLNLQGKASILTHFIYQLSLSAQPQRCTMSLVCLTVVYRCWRELVCMNRINFPIEKMIERVGN
jgi:hypothetical protein